MVSWIFFAWKHIAYGTALDHKEGFLGAMSWDQNDIHRTKIKQGTITPWQYIVVCPDKTIMLNSIYDIGKNIVNKAKKNQIAKLVLQSSLSNQSACSSNSIRDVVGKLVAVEMVVFSNLEGIKTQGYPCIIHLEATVLL